MLGTLTDVGSSDASQNISIMSMSEYQQLFLSTIINKHIESPFYTHVVECQSTNSQENRHF